MTLEQFIQFEYEVEISNRNHQISNHAHTCRYDAKVCEQLAESYKIVINIK